MADSSEEKTRDPTDKRLREAREEGQIAQSRILRPFVKTNLPTL